MTGFQTGRRGFLAGAGASGAMIALHPFAARAAAGQAHLRIMSTTDLHVHVYPYDYYADRPVDSLGLSRTASIIEGIRAEAGNAMLVDNGDFLQGNPMGDYMAYERGMKEGDLHPIIQGMNVLGYDAAAIGNHEFNYGLDFMMKTIAGAGFPVVCANVVKARGATPQDDERFVPPYVIVDKTVTDGSGAAHPIKVGLIGFCPPQIMNWDQRHLEGKAEVRDILLSAQAFVPEMKEAGADIVIALSHSGISAEGVSEGMENASLYLAAIEGIDAIVTGHHHLVFPGDGYTAGDGIDPAAGTLMGKPAAMGGFWGSHLGLIDLMLEREGGAWRVVAHESAARPIYERDGRAYVPLVEDHQPVLDAVAETHQATLDYIRRPVGETAAALHSYFALVADDPSVQIVSQAQRWYIEDMMRGTEWEGLPILSAAAPFKAGGRGGPEYYTDVAPGPVAIKNVADLYLYPNTARAVLIDGATVKDWLERSAGIFNQIAPGSADAPLLNPEFPSYNFDVIDGVSYQIDLSQPSKFDSEGVLVNPEANRIVDLTFDGAPIEPDQMFVVATNNYRAGGGGSFPGADGTTTVFVAPDTNRDVIVRYIVEQGTINPRADANWTFKPMPGTSVTFETGPAGAEHADAVEGVAIEPAGDAADGFALYRIAL
ncbi:MAG: bifunctional 2',3'-cyclic-nucleotide 2'-phosphodiesterase/3'-nucleotidase [Pseudomonadota bacterium]